MRRRWIFITISLVAFIGIFLAALPEIVKRIAVSQIRAATNRDAVIDDVDLNLFTRSLAVKGFTLYELQQTPPTMMAPFVTFERFDVRIKLLPLFGGHLRIRDGSLQGPVVRLVRTGPRIFNFSDLLERPKSEGGLDVTVENFSLDRGGIELQDMVVPSHQTWKAGDLSVKARSISTRDSGEGGTAAITFALGGTPITLNLSRLKFVPTEASITVAFQGFGLKSLLPYFEQNGTVRVEGGALGAQLTIDYGSAAGIHVTGDVDVENVNVFRRGESTAFVSLPRVTAAIGQLTTTSEGTGAKRVEIKGQATVANLQGVPPGGLHVDDIMIAFDDLAWPWTKPSPVAIAATLRQAGRLSASGTAALEPRIRVEGHAEVTDFKWPAGRPLVKVPSVKVAGMNVEWPSKVAAKSVTLRKMVTDVVRDKDGKFQWQTVSAAQPAAETPPATEQQKAGVGGASEGPPPTLIEIGELLVDDGLVKFTDLSTTPNYTDELTGLLIRVKELSSAPGRRGKVTVRSAIGSGGLVDLHGEVNPFGKEMFADLSGTLKTFPIPSTNPYMDRVLGWIARGGALSTEVHYHIEGDSLEATNEITVDDLRVARAGEEDDVVQRRIGLPLALLVDLMKDVHGRIHVSVPITGKLGSPDFSFSEAIWETVRNVVLKIIEAPFKLIGGLFTGEGNKIEAMAIEPVVFRPGTAAVTPESKPQLQNLAQFLKASPYIRLSMSPVISRADVDMMKNSLQQNEKLPANAEKLLSSKRLDVTRESLMKLAEVSPDRLEAKAADNAGDGAAGEGRVEFAIAR